MPSKLPSLCHVHGCGEMNPCPAHAAPKSGWGDQTSDPFYKSPDWRKLRAQRLRMDRGRCTLPGCPRKARHVDHVVNRKSGGPDTIENLRSLCADHHNQKSGREGGEASARARAAREGQR